MPLNKYGRQSKLCKVNSAVIRKEKISINSKFFPNTPVRFAPVLR